MTFDDLNQRYFKGRLPRYRVRLVSAIPQPSGDIGITWGQIDRRRKTITLRRAPAAELCENLLHEMAHAATNEWHGPKWLAEMKRLQALGAPINRKLLTSYETQMLAHHARYKRKQPPPEESGA
jgi:hypothetical protein